MPGIVTETDELRRPTMQDIDAWTPEAYRDILDILGTIKRWYEACASP
jgi:hypothetical protein